MAQSAAPRIGYGATVSFNSSSIPNVMSIKPPEAEVPKVKTTVLASTNTIGQPAEKYLPGAVNYSSVEIESQYDEPTYLTLVTAAASRTQATLVITALASGETWTATAWVSKGPSADFKAANEVVPMKVSFEVTSGFIYNGSSSVGA
jgi:hypothetical protein